MATGRQLLLKFTSLNSENKTDLDFNSLSPNIHIQILYSDLSTSLENYLQEFVQRSKDFFFGDFLKNFS